MKIGIGVAGEGQRNEMAPGDVDAKLLAEFPDRCVFGVFARLNLAAGKFPQTGKGLARWASRRGTTCQSGPPFSDHIKQPVASAT